MSESLFSSSWYRVAALVPRLRSHARIHRHRYRGRTWYVLQDFSSGRYHRFSPSAYFVLGLIDGRRSVDEIWQRALGRLGDDAPTQDETIRLLAQLHAVDVLQADVPSDIAELFERRSQLERRRWQSRLLNPFAIRVPLFDPERILARFVGYLRPVVGWAGLAIWLCVLAPAVPLLAVHWSELTLDVTDRVLAAQNLLLIWLLFPVIKALHEFGHAFICKALGGEVHEMGVMFLVLTPVPYVDASSASAFRARRQRVAVGAGGILVELFVAALAFYLWLAVEPGVVRTLAYNAIFIAGFTTIFFNANPLLRFDGYYILSDWIEIPNLGVRSNAYLGYLCERYLFGREEAEAPDATPGEKRWFVAYGVASFLYRLVVVAGIILFILSKFFVVGMLLIVLALVSWVVVPLYKGVSYVLASPKLRRVRLRAVAVSGGGVLAVAVLTGLLPVPLSTIAEGVIWVPEAALVRAESDGFLVRVVAEPGAPVRRGDVLFTTEDPELVAEVRSLEWQLRALEARYQQVQPAAKVDAEVLRDEIRYAEQALDRARQRQSNLVVRSRVAGRFVVPVPEDLPGRFVRKGELLAYVVDLNTATVRAAIPQDQIDLVRQRTRGVELRLSGHLSRVLPARVTRLVPEASEVLPSTALGTAGGGRVAVDPRDQAGATALTKLFSLELALESDAEIERIGERVYVRFDHGYEVLARQGYRSLRQLFLSRFDV